MRDGQLLDKQEIDKMWVTPCSYARRCLTLSSYSRHIPCVVVQGRYDVICPVSSGSSAGSSLLSFGIQAKTAYDLKKVWPEVTLHVVPDAGHSAREPGTSKLLVEATDKFADL